MTARILSLWNDRFLLEVQDRLADMNFQVAGWGYQPYALPLAGDYRSLGSALKFSIHSLMLTQHLEATSDVFNDLSEELLASFRETHLVYLEITDRLTIEPIPVSRRTFWFRRAFAKIWSIIETVKPDVVLFEAAPHGGWDNIVYAVAKTRGIRTLIPTRTLITDRVLLLDDYDSLEKVPQNYLSTIDLGGLRKRWASGLSDLVVRRSSWELRSRAVNAKAMHATYSSALMASIRALLDPRALMRSPFQPSYAALERPRAYFPVALHVAFRRFAIAAARRRYEALASHPKKPSIKRLYFAMHFQPERSTTPEGGAFADQGLAMRLLAFSLPKGWEMVIKDHPRQYEVGTKAQPTAALYRPPGFFEELLTDERVSLASLEVASEELIASATAVATITGSSGWEALRAGKPSIVLGRPWYAGCRSCYVVKSVADAQAAFAAIDNSTPERVEEDLIKFMLFTEQRMVQSTNRDSYAPAEGPQRDAMIHNLAEAVSRACQGERLE